MNSRTPGINRGARARRTLTSALAGNANPRYEQALAFAAEAHGAVRQARKGTDFPYVSHPIRVAEILSRFWCGEDAVVAGFLHDVIEDSRTTAGDISSAFGPRVAALVVAVSEPDKSLPRKTRMQQTIDHLAHERDEDVLALVAADKLDNIRSIADSISHVGHERTWGLFNAPRPTQHWYYRAIAAALLGKDPDSRLFRTLDLETRALFDDSPRGATG
ncbi:MAG: hypothetical protein QOE11_1863 [Solirubrobacteraceae bacterium]|nr:hypothetical protein [Solirubrobacteraceae bacterium]